MTYYEKIAEARNYVASKIDFIPDIAVILGSGLGKLAEDVENPTIIPYEDIPFWPRSTAPGHAGRLVLGKYHGHNVAVMQGRVHYYEGYLMSEVTFPVRVLAMLGVKVLVPTNASGAIKTEITPGSLVVIEDHINYMGTNPLIGENIDEWGPRFPDMSNGYDKELRNILEAAALRENITLYKGVYIGFTGPTYETPAEIRMARMLGADIVGMSTVPEVIVAAHMGMRVCAVSCAANFAAGIEDKCLTHVEVLDNMYKAADKMCALIAAFINDVKI